MNSPELSQENKENPETDVNREFKNAAETLKDVFDVKNLSTIELTHLRRITKDVVELAVLSNQPGSDLGRIQPDKEITIRFLQELYGIDYYHLNQNAKTDEDIEGFNEYIRRTRERAHLI